MSLLKLGLPIVRPGSAREAQSVVGREGMVARRLRAGTARLETPVAYRVVCFLVLSPLKLLFRFRVSGRINVPRDRPYIVVANHLNWLDSFALLIALPLAPRVHFIGWSNVLETRRLSWIIRTGKVGLVAIERDPAKRSSRRREMLRRLEQCVASGYPLVLFPEGQVGLEEGKLEKLHTGFARLALITGAPIVPVALSGTRRLWLGKRIQIAIGSPITPIGASQEEVVESTRLALTELMPPGEPHSRFRLFERRLTRLVPSLTNWAPSDL